MGDLLSPPKDVKFSDLDSFPLDIVFVQRGQGLDGVHAVVREAEHPAAVVLGHFLFGKTGVILPTVEEGHVVRNATILVFVFVQQVRGEDQSGWTGAAYHDPLAFFVSALLEVGGSAHGEIGLFDRWNFRSMVLVRYLLSLRRGGLWVPE